MTNRPKDSNSWQARWYKVIFEADTPSGKFFDIVLLVAIIASLIAIMVESVESISSQHRDLFRGLEWFFTIIFTAEYVIRLMIVESKRRYALSFYGIIDLLAVIPTYLAIFIVGAQYFLVVRSFRLIRVFRVLKMVRFLGEARVLASALKASRPKIVVFLVAVMCIVCIMGTVMYIVEGKDNGFRSIPESIYWCIVTLTTVGYGDISPQTPLGKMIASVIMILGYGLIAVPTGIVTAEVGRANANNQDEPVKCDNCGFEQHLEGANFCGNCGHEFD